MIRPFRAVSLLKIKPRATLVPRSALGYNGKGLWPALFQRLAPLAHPRRCPGKCITVSLGNLRDTTSAEAGELGLDGVEVREVLRRRGLFAVLDDAVFIDDEGGAGGDAAEADEIVEERLEI